MTNRRINMLKELSSEVAELWPGLRRLQIKRAASAKIAGPAVSDVG